MSKRFNVEVVYMCKRYMVNLVKDNYHEIIKEIKGDNRNHFFMEECDEAIFLKEEDDNSVCLKTSSDFTFYFKNGLLHRDNDLPAVEWNNKQPAYEIVNLKEWWNNGELIKDECEYINLIIEKNWYKNGVKVKEETYDYNTDFSKSDDDDDY